MNGGGGDTVMFLHIHIRRLVAHFLLFYFTTLFFLFFF